MKNTQYLSKIAKTSKILVLTFFCFTLFGCVSIYENATGYNRDSHINSSETNQVFLAPLPLDKKIVYLSFKNNSPYDQHPHQNFDTFRQYIINTFYAKGYSITHKTKKAFLRVKADLRFAGSSIKHSNPGALLADLASGAAIGGLLTASPAGAVAGVAIGGVTNISSQQAMYLASVNFTFQQRLSKQLNWSRVEKQKNTITAYLSDSASSSFLAHDRGLYQSIINHLSSII